MEALDLSLIILACVIGCAIICQLMPRLSPPLVQIAIGFLVALLVPGVSDVQLPSELFLVLFIAPLLFNDARHTSFQALWSHKSSVLSLALGLVFLTVLVVGFALNWLVPSISLAAAFACAAALAPTDAAAVGALGSSVNLTQRQEVLLSGESLINDASGVVAFQFACAAAVTGSFYALDVGTSFLKLFFGGIAVGVTLGLFGKYSVKALRYFGYESTTVHVLYEVFSPFFIFLFSEWLGVSGILAVVAAGLVMAEHDEPLTSTVVAQRQIVSNGFWRIIVFLINSVVFILLGTELPQAFNSTIAESHSLLFLLSLVAIVTLLIMMCRFVWVVVLELLHRVFARGDETKQRSGLFRNALVLTVGGPKGAVTLSIIFTLPMQTMQGEDFPERGLLIYLTAAVILCTLLIADFALPRLAPPDKQERDETELRRATIKVLEATLCQLESILTHDPDSSYEPALRDTIARYRIRLVHEREALSDSCGLTFQELNNQVRDVQEKRAQAIHDGDGNHAADRTPYYLALRQIRRSVGYVSDELSVGSKSYTLSERLRLLWRKTRSDQPFNADTEQIYYDTCLFAIMLEHAAISYLDEVIAQHDYREHAAQVLLSEHKSALDLLWNHINYGQDIKQQDRTDLILGHYRGLPEGMRPLFAKQLAEAKRYATIVDANALTCELDQIRHLQEHGEISLADAQQLRQQVYVLQMALNE